MVEARKYHFSYSFTVLSNPSTKEENTEGTRKKSRTRATCRDKANMKKKSWKNPWRGKKMLEVGVRHTGARKKARWWGLGTLEREKEGARVEKQRRGKGKFQEDIPSTSRKCLH